MPLPDADQGLRIQNRTTDVFVRAPEPIQRRLELQKAQVSQIRYDNARMRASIRAVMDAGLAYPYKGMRDLIVSKRFAALTRRYGPLTPEVIKGIIATRNENQAADITIQTEKLFKLSSWDEWSKTALQAGIIAAGVGAGIGLGIALAAVAIGAAAGSAVPVFGTLIGAAVGFIVGIATALFPLEKWKVMDNFARLVDKMGVVDRYVLWGACAKTQNNARALEKKDPLPDWWLKTPDMYTIFGDISSVTCFMYEYLGTSDCWIVEGLPDAVSPRDVSKWDPAAVYALACLASHGAEWENLVDTKFYRETVLAQKGSKCMYPYLREMRDVKVRDIRALAVSQGLKSFPDVVVTNSIADAITSRERQLSGA